MISWYGQELPTSCVSACVRMVLASFGVELPERQVRRMLGHTFLGLSLARAHASLQSQGALTHFHADWNAADLRDALRQKLTPIVGVERHILGHPPASHAVVVVALKSQGVTVLDPFTGPQAQIYSLQTFEMAWQLAGPEALIIELPPNLRP